jgi:hypothetical protein
MGSDNDTKERGFDMSKKYPIINPKASYVIGMYVNELVSMDHPIASMRLTSQMKAGLCYKQRVPLKNAIKSILEHIRYLFGDDIPDELVRVTVYLEYAWNTALKVKKDSPHSGYIGHWLRLSREARKSSNTEDHVNTPETEKIKGEESKEKYPKIYCWYTGLGGGYLSIPANATKDEILARAMLRAMSGPKVSVALSESETIIIVSPGWRASFGGEYPHIAAYNRVLIYPTNTTKEELVENAARIAATWCPKALVAWSSTETIWPS